MITTEQPVSSGAFPPVDGFVSQYAATPSYRGLEVLASSQTVKVEQKPEFLQWNPEYFVKNEMDQVLYKGIEERHCVCCNGSSIEIKLQDGFGNFPLHLVWNQRCDSCLGRQYLEVFSFASQLLGTLHLEWSLMSTNFRVESPTGNTELIIGGCSGGFFSDMNYTVTTVDGAQMGRIVKKWIGAFSALNLFEVHFPAHFDVRLKALIIAGAFYIKKILDDRRRSSN